MPAPRHVFHWDKFGRPVCRGKVLYRRVTKVVRLILEILRLRSPEGLSLAELQEATRHDDVADHLRRNTRHEPDIWPTIYQTPGIPNGDGGYKMFDRGSGPNPNRGGGFGPRSS